MSVVDPKMDGEPLSPESTEDNFIPGDLSNLTTYRSSSMLTRFFCSTCSAHMFFRSNVQADPDNNTPVFWTVMWGVLEKTDGIITLTGHIFIGDTLDGGIADHIRSFAGNPLKRLKGWKEGNTEELTLGWNAGEGYKNPETLPMYCHCKSVSFNIARAAKPSDNPAEYWLVPGKEPTDPIRFMSAHCLCNDCRLCSGGQIQSWTIVPNELILDPATQAPIDLVEPSKRPKGLKQYASSDGKHRESCGTCGATVFWWRGMKEGESPHLDVATALFDQAAAGGARAESWICWYNKLIFKDYALSGEVSTALEEGVKAATATASA